LVDFFSIISVFDLPDFDSHRLQLLILIARALSLILYTLFALLMLFKLLVSDWFFTLIFDSSLFDGDLDFLDLAVLGTLFVF